MIHNHGAHPLQRTLVNVSTAHQQVLLSRISRILLFTNILFLATVPTPSCVSSSLINVGSCSQSVPSSSVDFLFTPCTMGTVTSISPALGPAGTSITINGTGFSTTICENSVLLGSSYQCPITSASTTQIVCQVGSNSLLSARTLQNVYVSRTQRGFHSNNGLLRFQFQAQITSISPSQGW